MLANQYQIYKSEFRANLKLALPIIAGQLGQVTVNIIDTLMVGKLGASALASISTGNALVMVWMILGMGLSFGLPPLIAQADGAKQFGKVGLYFRHSLLINMVFSVLSVGMLYVLTYTLPLFGFSSEVNQGAEDYIIYSAWSFIPYMVFLTLRGIGDGFSKTSYAMGAIVIGNIINVIGNYALIYGHWGMPAYGVGGAALGSLFARIVMMLVMAYFLYNNDALWHFVVSGYKEKIQAPIIKQVLRIAVPTSLQMFFEVSAFSAAALIMGMVGSNEQAAHQIAINLASMTFLLCSGLSIAASIRIGNYAGRGDYAGVKLVGYSILWQVIGFMAVCAVIFLVGRFALPSLYIDDSEVIQLCGILMIYAAIFQIPDGVQVCAIGILRGLHDVRWPTIITFVAYWLIGLPISYFTALNLGWGINGVWLGLLLGLSFSGILLVLRFRRIVGKIVVKV